MKKITVCALISLTSISLHSMSKLTKNISGFKNFSTSKSEFQHNQWHEKKGSFKKFLQNQTSGSIMNLGVAGACALGAAKGLWDASGFMLFASLGQGSLSLTNANLFQKDNSPEIRKILLQELIQKNGQDPHDKLIEIDEYITRNKELIHCNDFTASFNSMGLFLSIATPIAYLLESEPMQPKSFVLAGACIFYYGFNVIQNASILAGIKKVNVDAKYQLDSKLWEKRFNKNISIARRKMKD